MSQALAMFQSVGSEQFSQMACSIAPYFSTINPLMVKLEHGLAEASIPFRREITNHLGSIHAIALCNAAEFVGGMMTDVSIPIGARWIPKGMTVEYLAKAKTDVRAIASAENVDWQTSGDKIVNVVVLDAENREVFKAAITMNVKVA